MQRLQKDVTIPEEDGPDDSYKLQEPDQGTSRLSDCLKKIKNSIVYIFVQ